MRDAVLRGDGKWLGPPTTFVFRVYDYREYTGRDTGFRIVIKPKL